MFRLIASCVRPLRFSLSLFTLAFLLLPIAARAQAPGTCDGMSLGTTATTGTVGGNLNGFVPFQDSNAWNTNVSSAATDPNSAGIVASWTQTIPILGSEPDTLTVNFGSDTNAATGIPQNGIPYVVVDSTVTPLQTIDVYGAEAAKDDVVVAPFPNAAGGVPIGGSGDATDGAPTYYGGNADCDGWPESPATGDNLALVLDRATCWLYETRGTTGCNGQYEADSETIWDMTNGESRPWGWPSADTSGLPVFPGLVRYDEVSAGAINHALAFTMSPTLGDKNNGYFVLPASYAASTTTTAHLLPTGARIRLRPSFNISSFSAANQVILTAMQQYGMILTDTGANFSVQGTPDARWDDTDLQTWAPSGELGIGIYELEGTGPTLANFEVVQMSPEYKGMDDVSAYTSTNPEYAAGHAIPVIDNFSANSKNGNLTITAGTPVTFIYTVTGDSYDYIDNIGPVRLTDGAGSVTITPTSTQEYTLYSTNAWGRASSTINVTVTGSVVTPPVFNPSPAQTGILNAAQAVSISTPTSSEAKIYYTTNGTAPTTSSTLFSGTLTVETGCSVTNVVAPETVEAIATVSGYAAPSTVSTATYTCGGKTATPTFSPGSGTYDGTQTVTISDTTPSASIYYTTNGTAPTSASTLYTAPISVAVSQTVEAIAELAIDSNSNIATARYTINPPATATPTFAPPAGTYTSVQTVTISDTQPSSAIYYTTGFGTPTTASTLYTGPITVGVTETIKAVDVAAGFSNSTVASATYTIDLPPAATPTFAPPAGSYTSIQSVTISDTTGGATIYYTTNGGTPTTNSTLYTTPVIVAVTQTLRAIAVLAGDSNSAVGTAAYTITLPQAATPTFSPVAGSYGSTQTVTISDTTGGVTIYYTVTAGTAGAAPTTASSVYTAPLTVANSEVIEAIAVETGYSNSAVGTAKYTITDGTTVVTPTFNPPAGTYSATSTPPAPLSVTISSTTPSSNIYYTTDGTTPVYPIGGTTRLFTAALTISANTTVKAIGELSGDNNSAVATAIYTLSAAATPTFNPVAGSYTSIQTVTISDTAVGSSIYYTTNGGTPTTNSTLYTAPITVSVTQTLRAIAVVSGDSNSAVGSAAYSIDDTVATPTFTPAANLPYISPFTSPQSVTISDTTGGATIYYTTDGTTPTTASTTYTGPITVSNPTPEGSVEVEALAVKNGLLNSTVGTVTYYFDIGSVGAPSFSPGTGAYSGAQTVTISDATAGVTIYYTITAGSTGTTPTTASSAYSTPISVTPPSVVEAFAAKSGYANSAVVSAIYSVTTPAPTPSFNPPAGNYYNKQYISIGDGAPSATIYFTTNGTAPTTASPQYTGIPITIVGAATPTTVEAIATAAGYSQSAVGSATYNIPIPAQLTIPTPGTQLTGTTVTFGWTPGSASTHFELWLGTTGVGTSNLYNSGSVTATSEVVTNLPSNGEMVYARLYFYVFGTWQENDYTYTAYGSPQLPYIESPTPGTQLGSSALFTWNPGNIASAFQLYVGSTGVGSNNIYNSGSVTATSENVSGIPANGATVNVRLWWLVGAVWSSADYTYTTTGGVTPAALTTPVPGTQLTGTTVTFGWTPGNTATHFELWLGSKGVGTSNLYNTGSVTATSEIVGGLPSNGEPLYARLYYMINGNWISIDYTYTAYGSATPASLTTPTPGSKLGGTRVTFSWNPGNRATTFQLFLGTTGVGSNNIYNSLAVTATSETVSGLPDNGEEVYARLFWYINGSWNTADYTYTAAGTAVAAALTEPSPGTKLTGTSVTFGWNPGNIATNFELLLGNTGVGSDNLYNSNSVTVTSETVSDLPDNGEPVNARLYSYYNGAWHSSDYTYTAAGTPVLPSLSTPTPSSTLTGTSVTFTWNPGNAATHFELWVGNTTPGSTNIYDSGSVTATTETVSGLPANGEPVYVRLYYYLNGSWSYIAYTYTASGSPTLPALTTPTPSTTLTGTSVAFSWSPGNAAVNFELLVGTTGVGSDNLYNSNSVTVTTETVSDLPSNGAPVYVRLFWYLNGAWSHADYRYTAY